MIEQKAINLPFVETISRSFMYTLCNWELFLKIVSVGLVVVLLEMFIGFPILCSLSEGTCPEDGWQTLSGLVIFLVSIGMIVNYCRVVILKAPLDFLSRGFFRRVLKYFLATLVLGFTIVMPFVLLMFIYVIVIGILGGTFADKDTLLPLMFIAIIAWSVYLAPVFLILPAITVDDKSVTVYEAFTLTKGNYNKIFWGQVVMAIPGTILLYLLAFLYQAVGVEGYLLKVLFTMMVLGLSFMDSCFKASFIAHIYQYFIFYKNKQVRMMTLTQSEPAQTKPLVKRKPARKRPLK